MPRSQSRPVVIKYNSKEDVIKANNYLKLLHGQNNANN